MSMSSNAMFLKERQIEWMSASLSVLEECHRDNSKIISNARNIHDIAKSIVISHNRESGFKNIDFLNVYPSLVSSAFKLERRPHLSGTEAAVARLLPDVISDMTEMITKRNEELKRSLV